MKNYKINIDKPKPTQEEILAGRNFDAVLAQYKAAPGKVIKKPFWQTGGFIASVVAVAATVTIAVLVMSGQGEQNTSEPVNPGIADNSNVLPANEQSDLQWQPAKRKIAPPLADVNVPYQKYKVSAKWGGSILYPTGTRITFQPNSFVDRNGNTVTGNVDVQYREMHDAVDFFLAGVPMEYDSAGKTWQLESAGMMEVAAFVNGEVVYLKKDQPMQVDMASAEEGTQYNLYHFDTVAGNWVYQGKDKVSNMPVEPEVVTDTAIVVAHNRMAGGNCSFRPDEVVLEPVEPKQPVKANPGKNRFLVDFNKEEFPEMASYQNVIFEVDESREKFDHANYNITWESIALSRGEKADDYRLTLKKGLKTVKLDVYPVLDGKDYELAMAEYTEKQAQYVKDKERYDAWLVAKENNFQNIVFDKEDQNNLANNAWVYTSGNDKKSNAKALDIMRSFTLSGFGVYNMDVASMLPQGSVLNLTVNGPDGKPFADFTTVNHVDRQKNTVMSYHNENPMNRFHCNTKSANLIWAVKNGELYYAENEQFANLPATGNAVIALKKVGRKLNTADEMRAFFHLQAPSASN